ncbi:hypothetical protein F5Y10DRAFT_233284 [Nemania abortiva]|nr:hypothetical protein F5Y10DRAFT_233284 [Nemania abortiva]
MTTARPDNGRDFLLRILPQLEAHPALYYSIIIGLFAANDQISVERLGINESYNKWADDEREMTRLSNTPLGGAIERKAAKRRQDIMSPVGTYSLFVVNMANQVARDVLGVTNLIHETAQFHSTDGKRKKWEQDIGNEIVAVANFLGNFVQTLELLSSECGQRGRAPTGLTDAPTFDDLHMKLGNAKRNIALQTGHLKLLLPIGPTVTADIYAPSKAPGVTIRELAIRMDLERVKGDLINAINMGEEELADSLIDNVIQNVRRALGVTENLDQNGVTESWCPRAITMMIDSAHGIVLTGATNPGCDGKGSGLVRNAVLKITRLRAGEHFTRIAEQLTDKFVDKLKVVEEDSKRKPRSDDQIRGHYHYLTGIPSDVKLRVNRVWIWTYDGWTLKPKPPCLRCQSMCPTLVAAKECRMYGMPVSVEDKRIAIDSANERMRIPGSKCTFCAETVAAAKLYALYNGTVGFIN